ncbi:RloB family protein [Massilia sp. METH4]|uniref:RloB family protein n=1 Tax=Massilia sp. METH4 TaxID=3123041 RepID=UPI0030CF2C4E
MTLLSRRKRPIRREQRGYRDDRLFVIACDDRYAPKQYFDSFEIPRIQVHVIPTEDGKCGAEHVLERLLRVDCEPDDERWLVLDTDHYVKREHLRTFTRVLQEARQKGIQLALSRSCFEVWLLLHFVEPKEVVNLKNAKAVSEALKAVLGEYDKTALDCERFSFKSVVDACRRAAELDKEVEGGDIPASNTTRVYLLWKSIVQKALRTQLPLDLIVLLE